MLTTKSKHGTNFNLQFVKAQVHEMRSRSPWLALSYYRKGAPQQMYFNCIISILCDTVRKCPDF